MNSRQSTSDVLMVRPAAFSFNEQTSLSNLFQSEDAAMSAEEIQLAAMEEFDGLVNLLRDSHINVTVVNDTEHPVKPDALFPNNWVAFEDGDRAVLFPLAAANRRPERRSDVIDRLRDDFMLNHVIDLTDNENDHRYLEGTGSMVVDHVNRILYACLSLRTDKALLEAYAGQFGYRTIEFTAKSPTGEPIYHTNVMMSIGTKSAVMCLECVEDPMEKRRIVRSLESTGHELIEIGWEQVKAFAGNMLELTNREGHRYQVMSSQAYASLLPDQIKRLEHYAELIHCPLGTIETLAGGSARCMIAEIFLDRK